MDDLTRDLTCYLVGGAVRDQLLGRPVRDRDWVVVGATPEKMRALGFVQVGADFPVFLHPTTHEEYALARTERKQGRGHKGFAFDASPGVTLEQDLSRRDLTINAMAMDHRQQLIDPLGGARDIEDRLLRHVTDAFAEDPLRVFRVARLAAQLPGFEVVPTTLKLMMTLRDELVELSAERVWQELLKALNAPEPHRFFTVLAQCEGWTYWFSETQGSVPRMRAEAPRQRFAEIFEDHASLTQMSQRLRAPNDFVQCADDYLAWSDTVRHWQTSSNLLEALLALQVLHRPHRLIQLCDLLQRQDDKPYERLIAVSAQLKTVRIESAASGAAYGAELRDARQVWLAQRIAAL